MGEHLDVLAVSTAVFTRAGKLSEAVVYLREGKALKKELVRRYSLVTPFQSRVALPPWARPSM